MYSKTILTMYTTCIGKLFNFSKKIDKTEMTKFHFYEN